MRNLYKILDESPRVSALLNWFRVKLPARRGLMLLMAIAVSALSLLIHVLWILTGSALFALCGIFLLHGALIGGFFGILLAEALGRGYRE
jgi:hypothetical protein